MKKCIIIGNGKAPGKSLIRYLQSRDYSTIICADGGADSARNLGFIPDYIIGDFDSISTETLKYYSNKSKIIRIPRQNDTDIEKCLKLAVKKGINKAAMTGVTGDRLDHTFCNLGILLKFFSKIEIEIIADKSFLRAYTGKVSIKTKAGEIISLYGFDGKTKINSKGLKYPLKKTALPFGKKESTSNVALSDKVDLKISGGIVFVIRDFNTLMRNGLF